jgi:hypothetical protein
LTGDPAGLPTDLSLEARELLLALLRAELTSACVRALAHGVSPKGLAESLDTRVARLQSGRRTTIGEPADDVEYGSDDPVHLRRIVE